MSDDEIYQRFQQAYITVDPEPLLLQLLKEYPYYGAVDDLVTCYIEAVEENPSRGGYLASTLDKVANSPEAPTFDPPDSVACFVNRILADHHFKVMYGDLRVKEYGPKNTYLLDSFLSGLSFKYRLTTTSTMLASLCDGFKLDTLHGSDESPQVLVVGTCIQLLVHGYELVTDRARSYMMSPEEVASKLKAHKAAGVIKDPHALQVLDLTISLAETGFKPENDREDVWDILFPKKA
ncbi:hypothetical protein CPB84DRAFT_1773603 [Gymnopilus junonius]|uniref:Uncharacterized protein n=1 Tax=Gymnopilus junonius TaxID=109634 RepID=A0A9P5NPA6_GYMJU|nr:hypothetical protein CPB84DRAFT_1773603 [Gymnopilus junonius]